MSRMNGEGTTRSSNAAPQAVCAEQVVPARRFDLDALRLPVFGAVTPGPGVDAGGAGADTGGPLRESVLSLPSVSEVTEWGLVPSDKPTDARFLRLPWRWLCQAVAHVRAPYALVGASLHENFHPKWQEFRSIPQGSLDHLHLGGRTIRRALAALEEARLVAILRPPGRPLALRLLVSPGDRYFVPPVAVSLVQEAAALGAPAALLLFAIVRWVRIGGGRPVMLTRRRYGELGMARSTARRALHALVGAGLVSLNAAGRIASACSSRAARP